METVIRNVRDIDSAHRQALEHVVGQRLGEHDQIIINVVTCGAITTAPPTAPSDAVSLPEWCNVYEGLTDAEIEEIEKSIVRTPGSRNID
jgi:hypothetical protein